MPEFWEARIIRITVSDDQSQMHETTFQQRIETEPDLQPLIDAYGPSLHAPPMLATMMPPGFQGG
jgi:hypothetical protein